MYWRLVLNAWTHPNTFWEHPMHIYTLHPSCTPSTFVSNSHSCWYFPNLRWWLIPVAYTPDIPLNIDLHMHPCSFSDTLRRKTYLLKHFTEGQNIKELPTRGFPRDVAILDTPIINQFRVGMTIQNLDFGWLYILMLKYIHESKTAPTYSWICSLDFI